MCSRWPLMPKAISTIMQCVSPAPEGELAQAFSLWSYTRTCGQPMVTDAHACTRGSDMYLTSHAIHAPRNEQRFPLRNLEKQGLKLFFASHQSAPHPQSFEPVRIGSICTLYSGDCLCGSIQA